jgi:hypothetical protein
VVLPETFATPTLSLAVIVMVELEEPHVHVCP